MQPSTQDRLKMKVVIGKHAYSSLFNPSIQSKILLEKKISQETTRASMYVQVLSIEDKLILLPKKIPFHIPDVHTLRKSQMEVFKL